MPNNFLDEVLMRSKEILNYIDQTSTSIVADGLKSLQLFFASDEEEHLLKTNEVAHLIDFLGMKDDHCIRIIRDVNDRI